MSDPAENARSKQRGRPFEPGMSGNPAGKPRGVRNKASLLLDRMAQADAGDVLQAVLDKAKSGDVPAATLILARLWPPRKARVRFHLPEMRSAADLVMGLGCLAAAVAAGELAPEEAAALAAVLESQRRAIETIELERRIAALERTGTQR